uniref:Caspase activity and apoptosis inhibitor 1 n=1 Tax=Neolamprologus brichardi TaxID=32507 RepID=A0A3Q4H9J5_NEOBR
MLKKKSSTSEKKRKHFQSEERHDSGKRRSTGPGLEVRLSGLDELADPELDKIGSDIEEGGLDLSLAFKPITAYVGDKREMLEQCFHVLGEKKLRKMLPDELKECSVEEIKTLCWEQLEPIMEKNLIQILAGKTEARFYFRKKNHFETSAKHLISHKMCLKQLISEQLHCDCVFISHVYFFPPPRQDSIVDSTSCLKETAKSEDPKQEAGGSGEESDVLSINADTYDSDIEGPKEEQTVKEEQTAAKDIQSDIDKSVSEILACSSTPIKDAAKEPSTPLQSPDVSGPVSSGDPAVCKPSIQQLELLELEMRARAIKALMKARRTPFKQEENLSRTRLWGKGSHLQ